jgi:hypothetical protein
MFFCFCPHIFCILSESGVRELFNIFYSEGGIVLSHETFDLRPY